MTTYRNIFTSVPAAVTKELALENSKHKSPMTALREFRCTSAKQFELNLPQIQQLLNSVTEKDILEDGNNFGHPLLHELCHQTFYAGARLLLSLIHKYP